ncbi:transcription factor TFIIE beta subunit, TFIIEB, Tfa2 [Dispira simplex]|nr:transcription factor TFIIE beta subunit, TFIIEB, Tfa2 [Dispira simplex]
MSSLLRQSTDFKKRLASQPTLKRHIIHRPVGDIPQPVAKKPKGESFFREQRGRISTATSAPVSHMSSPRGNEAVATPLRPTGTMVYDVISHLKSASTPQTAQEIEQALGIEITSNEELHRCLVENGKVIYDSEAKTFAYKPAYDIRSADDLLELLQSRANQTGTDLRDLRDSYINVRDVAEPLIREGKVLATRNKDNVPRMLYYNTHPELKLSVTPDFKTMWHELKVPDEADLAKELNRAGLKQMEVFEKKVIKPESKSKRAKQRNRRVKITNTHLEGIDLTKDYVGETQ